MNACATTMLIFCLLFLNDGVRSQGRVEKRLSDKKLSGIQRDPNANYFLVVGDWGRNGQGDAQDVADWMGVVAAQFKARFVISTGDNFYCCGVASTEDYQWISSYENVFRSHSLQIPWYVTLGNHDYQGNVQAQIDYTRKNQRWKMPDRYFTASLNGVRFVFIDTSPLIREHYKYPDSYPDLHQQDTVRQLAWLDSVLTSANEKWKVVVGHHPVYSVGDHGSEPDMERLIEGRLEKHSVDVYFAGHDHSLQSLQKKGSRLYHLISGGGSEHTPVKPNDPLVRFASETTGFLLVEQRADQLRAYFINSKGKVIYTEIISK